MQYSVISYPSCGTELPTCSTHVVMQFVHHFSHKFSHNSEFKSPFFGIVKEKICIIVITEHLKRLFNSLGLHRVVHQLIPSSAINSLFTKIKRIEI